MYHNETTGYLSRSACYGGISEVLKGPAGIVSKSIAGFLFPFSTRGDPGIDRRLYRKMAAGKKGPLEIYVFLDYI
jgi:hypothetical protein